MRKRLLKKDVDRVNAKMERYAKWFGSHNIDVADPHVYAMLSIIFLSMEEIKKVTK